MGLESAKAVVETYLCFNFVKIVKRTDFLKISKNALVRYLSDPELCLMGTETEIYRGVLRWIKHDSSRFAFAEELLQHIRMHHIPAQILHKEVKVEHLVNTSNKLKDMVKYALKYHASKAERPLMRVQPARGELAVMFTEGYYSDEDHCLAVGKINTGNMIKAFPCPNEVLKMRCRTKAVATVAVGNFVYIFSKEYEYCEPATIRYDATLNTWIMLEPVPREDLCYDAFAAVVDGSIMLAGGQGDGWMHCHLYDIASDDWKKMVDLPHPMKAALTCTHNRLVYVTAGIFVNPIAMEATVLKKMWTFDVQQNVFLPKANSLTAHEGGAFEAIGNFLYLVGGRKNYGDADEYNFGAEVYNITTGQWTDISQTNPSLDFNAVNYKLRQNNQHSFVTGNKMYIITAEERYPVHLTIIDMASQTVTSKSLGWKLETNVMGVAPIRISRIK